MPAFSGRVLCSSLRWVGCSDRWAATPVDRTKSHDVVEQVADIFRKEDHFILALAPEGTRKKVDKPCGLDFITSPRKPASRLFLVDLITKKRKW